MEPPTILLTLGASGLLGVLTLLGLSKAFRAWYVTTDPDEYVVHYRRGQVVNRGRGLAFFCLPGDTYLKVPSTIRDINFAADQITQEKQGVRVQGFLAYKVADFDLAYQCLDLKARSIRVLKECAVNAQVTDYKEKNCEEVIPLDPSDPMAKTDMVLRRLAESVVRHEVSNKSVDEMITEREAVIRSMREQLQETVNHWGIEIDTIEFTEVWIRSRELFENLQADYRNQTRLSASQSTAATDRQIAENRVRADQEIATLEAESDRIRRVKASEEARAAQEAEARARAQVQELELVQRTRLEEQQLARKQELDRLAKQNHYSLQEQELALEQAAELARLEAELARQQEEHRAELDRRSKVTEIREREVESARKLQERLKQKEMEAAELERQLAEVRSRAAQERLESEAEQRRIQAEGRAREVEITAAGEKSRIETLAEARLREGSAEAEALRLRTEAENAISSAHLQKRFIEGLPEMAGAMGLKDVRWINMPGAGAGSSPLEALPRAIASTMGIFQGMGLDLEETLRGANRRETGALAPGVPAPEPGPEPGPDHPGDAS